MNKNVVRLSYLVIIMLLAAGCSPASQMRLTPSVTFTPSPTTTPVPPSVSPFSTAAPAATLTQTLLPTVEPASLAITPATLGQLRLRWNINFPGDFNIDPSCDSKVQECHLYTNISSYAFSQDGNILAVAVCLSTRTEDKSKPDQNVWGCTGESAIILFNSATGEERGRLVPAVLPLSLAFNPEGTFLAAGLANSDIELWDMSSNKRSGVLKGGPKYVGAYPLAFSPDGNLLISGGGFQLQLWNWRTSVLLKTIDRVIGIGISPDGLSLVTLHLVNEPDAIRVYDLGQNDRFYEIHLAGQYGPTEFSFNPQNGWMSSVEVGSNSYLVNFWNLGSKSLAATFDFKRDYDRFGVIYSLNSGGFTPDGYFLLSRYGKLTAPEAQPAATGLSGPLWACGFALADMESGQTFFSPPMLYDECTGPQYMYDMGSRGIQPQILSPDGRFIAADDGYGNLRLWGVDSSLPAIPPECSGGCPAP